MSKKVLVVDDDPLVLSITSQIIKRNGYEVFEVDNAKNALEIWTKNKIGIVLTDINLGGDMDGLSLCSRILTKDRKTIVIAMTGHPYEYPLEFCLNLGFRDFLLKPIEMEDLKNTIDCASKQRERFIRTYNE